MDNLGGALISAISGMCCTFFFIAIFGYCITSSLKEMKANDKLLNDTIMVLKNYLYIAKLLAAAVVPAGSILLLLLVDYEFQQNKNQYNFVLFLRDICVLAYMTVFWILAHYFNSISTGPIFSDFYPRLCYVFNCWDANNRKLFPS